MYHERHDEILLPFPFPYLFSQIRNELTTSSGAPTPGEGQEYFRDARDF